MTKTEINKLLSDFPEYITKEQMYKVCKISKKKARLLLLHGLIPCENTGKSTHSYKIKTADVAVYLQEREKHPEKYTIINELPSDAPPEFNEKRQKSLYQTALMAYDDILRLDDVAQISMFSTKTVCEWVKQGKLKAFNINRTLYIPKISLIEFMVTPYYRHSSRFKRNRMLIS